MEITDRTNEIFGLWNSNSKFVITLDPLS
jgi:hypothetical protein